jgi:hypothetical protein
VAAIARYDQQFARLQVVLPIFDNDMPVPSHAKHQVVLPGAAWPASEVIAGFRKPANVGRVERLDERVPPGVGQDRARDHVHILAGETLSHPDGWHDRKIIQVFKTMSILIECCP